MALLDKNRKVEAPAPKSKPSGDNNSVKVKGLSKFARVDAVLKALSTIHSTLLDEVKDEGGELLLNAGAQAGKRPANLNNAVESDASGSIQLKSLPVTTRLSEDALKVLESADVPLKEVEDVPTTYIINPKYQADEALIGKIEKALSEVEGIPEDFFQYQHRVRKVPDGSRTLDAIFALKTPKGLPDRSRIETLLPLVSTLAVRATTTASLEDALDTAEELLLESVDAAEETNTI